MIRNRCNYHTPSVKNTNGKERCTKATVPQSKHYKQTAKRTVSFPNIGQTAIQNKHFTRTYNDRNSKPQQRHSLGMVSKTLLGGLNLFYVATTLALSSAVVYTRHLFSPREGFLTHQCNISKNIKIKREMKQRCGLDSKK